MCVYICVRWFKLCSTKSSYKILCITSFLKENLAQTRQSCFTNRHLKHGIFKTEIHIFSITSPNRALTIVLPILVNGNSSFQFFRPKTWSHAWFHSPTSISNPLANPVNRTTQYIQILSTLPGVTWFEASRST